MKSLKEKSIRLGIFTDHFPGITWPGMVNWPEHTYAHLAWEVLGNDTSPPIEVILFTPTGIDWQRRTVRAAFLSDSESFSSLKEPLQTKAKPSWKVGVTSLPDVIYNRISRRNIERQPACQRIIRTLSELCPFFNPRFIQKGEVHTALSTSQARCFTPDAVIVKKASEFNSALNIANVLFVKPIDGSLGRGVVCLKRVPRGFAFARNRHMGRPPQRGIASSSAILRLLETWGVFPALIQRGVQRARWNNHPFDLRLLAQKDPYGKWDLTGIAGRVARTGQLTTHVHRGGKSVSFSRLRTEASVAIPPIETFRDLAIKASKAVDTHLRGSYFEFSLDVAVDHKGQPWILEMNAKPFPFDEEVIRKRAAMRLFRYAHVHAIRHQRASRRMKSVSTARAGL